jgi:autotransporter-associated beta strand protein
MIDSRGPAILRGRTVHHWHRRRWAFAAAWLVVGISQRVFADGFNVGALPGLQWWASAESSQLAANPDGSGTVGAGGPVGFISDLSGHGHDAVMGNSIVPGGDSYRPLLQTNLVGGAPGILFDGQNDFASLQSAFSNNASALTVAFAIEGANSSPSNQYFFGTNTALLGFSTFGAPVGVAGLNNGQSINLRATQGFGLNSTVGPDATMVIIARFQANGESDLFQNGVLIGSTPPVSPTAVSSIHSPNINILGNINYASAAGGCVAPNGTGSKFYFLEGLATTSALSDSQISQVYDYLSQQWPGVQEVASSPNIYGQTVTNQASGHIQGIAVGDGERFAFHSNMIVAYDSQWHVLTYNPALSNGVVGPDSGFHSGDGAYAQGKLFAPLEQDLAGGGATIGVYDATKPGLPLITAKNIATPQHEMSSLVVVPTQGAHGIIYISSFEAGVGGDKLWMYDYAGGNVTAPNFGNFLGTLQIPSSVVSIQGVAYKAPYFYFSDGTHSAIERVLYQDGVLADQAETVWTAPTTVQGLGFDGANLWQVLQAGSTTEVAWELASAKFNTIATNSLGSWNFNADSSYGGNSGFDPIIPNGPGSIAQFGDGTTDTLTNPSIHVTIDGNYTLGSLVFNPTKGAVYALVAANTPGSGLTLDGGAGQGANITVSSGNHSIGASLTIADAGGLTLSVAAGSSLEISGPLGESGGSRAVTVTGGGTLTLGSTNSYSGGTTVSGATLQTTANGALGPGPLTINSQPAAPSTVVVGGNETVGGLSGTIAPNVPSVLYIGPGARLNVQQGTDSSYQGTLVTSGTFSKMGAGTLELGGTGVMILGGPLSVGDSGILRLRLGGGAMVASGVVAQVNGSATLELAGSVSNLSSEVGPPTAAAVVNNSNAVAGVLVTGTNQRLGGIDGAGNVVVADGGGLTADHIIQTALVIGGSPSNPASVTITSSDSQGNPLDVPGASMGGPSLGLPGANWAVAAYGLVGGDTSILAANGKSAVQSGPASASLSSGSSAASTGAMGVTATMSGGSVPEPSSWVLIAVALVPLYRALLRRPRRSSAAR